MSGNVWPYPRWVAHRGAGKLAPENTLAAFRLGAQYGYRMFECDVKLSRDGVPFLLHDTDLARTTEATGNAGEREWSDLSRLDAGAWHSRAFAGEPLPTLEGISRFCRTNGLFLNIEIKPSPGLEAATGHAVATSAQDLWRGAPVPPLLTSFRPEALASAREACPELPRGLLLDTLWPGWLEMARSLQCCAIVCNYSLWNTETVAAVQGAGMRTASYTVNDESIARHLMALGTDVIITDRVDLFAPADA